MSVRVARSDLNPTQIELIRKFLCLQPQDDTHRYNGAANQKFFVQPKPPVLFYQVDDTHVNLPYAIGWAITQKPPNQDKTFPPAPIPFTGELFEHQKPIEEEAYQQLLAKGTTTIGLYPGFGKTVVGAKLSSRLGLYTAIICHREFLCEQWEKTFKDFTGATIWIVGATPPPPIIPHITICMDTRVALLPKDYRDKIGCLIIDEAHALCTASRIDCLLGWEPKYIIAETATLIRRDGMHSMIQSMCGVHGIFKTSAKAFDVVKLETGFEPETVKNVRGGLDFNALLKALVTSEYRNQLILSLIKQNPQRKILVLTRLKDHISILYQGIKNMGETVDYFAGNKKTYSDSRILLGTISKIGTGFDEKTACPNFGGQRIDMLILGTSIKDLALLEQSVGRIFRAEMPAVIDLVDNNTTLKSHYYNRKKWYQSRNASISEVKMIPEDQAHKLGKGKKIIKTVYSLQGQVMTTNTNTTANAMTTNTTDIQDTADIPDDD